MKARLSILWVLCLLLQTNVAFSQNQVLTHVHERINAAMGGYYESLPVGYASNPSKKYPLIISFHGIGELGDGSAGQITKLLSNGLPRLINEKRFPSSLTVGGEQFSFIVVSPQLSSNYRNPAGVVDVINHCIQKYRVDPDRIYLTGLSMGGGLAWLYAGHSKAYADRLAAMLVICGNTQAYPNMVKAISSSNLPVWITHNSNDNVVPTTHSTKWEQELNATGIQPQTLLNIFDGGGHDAWTQTYDPGFKRAGLNVFEWMLMHKRGALATPIVDNTPPVSNAGSNQTITLPANSVTLSGSGKDSDGTILKYAWTKVSGGTANIVSPSAAKTNVTGLVEGIYVFRLTVTDDKGATGSQTVTITVNARPVDQPVVSGPAPSAPAGNGVANNPADCGCTVTLSPAADGGIYVTNGGNYAPGSVLCIKAGRYSYINLQNIRGTASNPVIIKNCGGQVVVSGRTYGISITKSSHFKFVGTGAPGSRYGIKVDGSISGLKMGSGLGISNQSSDFEISNIEISHVDAGVICKTNPTCDEMTWGGNYTMRNVVMHDMYVHDVNGEGFYVGHTGLSANVTCNGKTTSVPTQTIENLKIYNCITENTGWDGIQVSNVPLNCEVFNNTIKNYGTVNKSSQQMGLLFGGFSNGKVYNNYIEKGTGAGLMILGIGEISAYNNIVIDCGNAGAQDGIYVDDRPITGYPALRVNLINNTVVRPGRNTIRIENSRKSIVGVNQLINNLLVQPGVSNAQAYIAPRGGVKVSESGNVTLAKVEDARFVNAGAKDFHLAANSPAVDAGVDVVSWGVTKDKDGQNRKNGSKVDAGAFEFNTGQTVVNQPPAANAGPNQTITLPTNSVTLSGSGTDSDGKISKYAWTKVSGGAATIASPSAAKTNVTGLVEGSYVFRLTVTDDKGATGTANVTVTVKPAANKAPTANAGSAQTITLPTNSITLSGSGTDSDGKISKYAWTKVSGGAATIASPSSAKTNVTGLVAGSYVFRLTVTDDKGATGTATVTITVKAAANKAPVANAGSNQTITLPTNSITLSGSGTDSDGKISKYAWTKVSGGAATIASPSSAKTNVTGLVAGSYVFRLTVTDDKGATGTATVTITVKKAEVVVTPTDKLDIKINPNPVKTAMNLTVDCQAKGRTIARVYDIKGVLLLQTEYVKDVAGQVSKQIDVSKLPSGLFIVQVTVDYQLVKSAPMVKY